jgi:hypothetical protein
MQVWWFCVLMSNLHDHLLQPNRHIMTRMKCFGIDQVVSRNLIGRPGSVKSWVVITLSHVLRQGNLQDVQLWSKYCRLMWACLVNITHFCNNHLNCSSFLGSRSNLNIQTNQNTLSVPWISVLGILTFYQMFKHKKVLIFRRNTL